MINDFLELKTHINKDSIKIKNNLLHQIIKDYDFLHVSKSIDLTQFSELYQNMKESKEVIINSYQEQSHGVCIDYFIIGFKKNIIIIYQSDINYLQDLFLHNSDLVISFLPESKEKFDKNISIQYKESEININMDTSKAYDQFRLCFFANYLKTNLSSSRSSLEKRWCIIYPCIFLFLVKQSYHKLNQNRIQNFFSNSNFRSSFENVYDHDYINLIYADNGASSTAYLCYDIKREEILIKKTCLKHDLFLREIENYKKINHPFLPIFYGISPNHDDFFIEYINDKSLYKINEIDLSINDKFTIIFELMLVFEYLHRNHLIYRDLKPNNVMIDKNKSIVLIDFDRMVDFDYLKTQNNFTIDFGSDYIAPELNSKYFTYKSDVYSLGKMIYYILKKELKAKEKLGDFGEYNEIIRIYNKCISKNPDERPSISQIIIEFYIEYHSQIQIENLFELFKDEFNKMYDSYTISVLKEVEKDGNNSKTLNDLGFFFSSCPYIEHDLFKSIHYLTLSANQKNPYAMYNLGSIYIKNKLVRDAEKGIQYYKCAANEGFLLAQIDLGYMYYENREIGDLINQAIYYFSLAANQNDLQSQKFLGNLYYEGKDVPKNIEKAIHYYSLAANQNDVDSQLFFGEIYYEGKDIPKNINKAIHYYALAANQNSPKAQSCLGKIYYEGKDVPQNIEKAIHYFLLAANQNELTAQIFLGLIYFQNSSIPDHINKAIHYFLLTEKNDIPEVNYLLGIIYRYKVKDMEKSLVYLKRASNKNYVSAQFLLGNMYYFGSDVEKNIQESIHYYSLAANQNDYRAQFNLGLIYYKSPDIKNDINKAIHYFSLAAEQNYFDAQYFLGIIYKNSPYTPIDINKAVYYLSLAANQNDAKSQYELACIYNNKEYFLYHQDKAKDLLTLAANQNFAKAQFALGCVYYYNDDINNAIHFFELAANQNIPEAKFNLGIIYSEGKLIQRDINKGIYYFSLAAKQNHKHALCSLGYIYLDSMLVVRDVNKAIYYYSLAADLNCASALAILGAIYNQGKGIKKDVNKAIYYYTLAADQGDKLAQFNLGNIYYKGQNVPRDIHKAIHYFTLSANQNFMEAQHNLGSIYFAEKEIPHDINKSLIYLKLAAGNNDRIAMFLIGMIYYDGILSNLDVGKEWLIHSMEKGNVDGNFVVGFLYHEEKRIIDAIKCYKYASSFNNQYAKNNLGIIYKNGFENQIQKNIGSAIEYFDEARRQKNDIVAMFNLSSIYIYEMNAKYIDEAIKYLIESSINGFQPSEELLCIALIMKFGSNTDKIYEEIIKYVGNSNQLPNIICKMIEEKQLSNPKYFKELYNLYKNIDFLYNHYTQTFQSHEIFNQTAEKSCAKKEINKQFYEGFGLAM